MPFLPCYQLLAVAFALLLISPDVAAFQSPLPQTTRLTNRMPAILIPQSPARITSSVGPTSLSMYNLPPSGGGGGGNNNVVSQLLGGALTIGAIVLFFVSPLGGIFFAITNSLFLLALITPVILTIAFQIWQSLNTVEGPCPNCGAPTRVLKDPAQPSLCFNCGTILQVGPDLKTIELSTPTKRQGGGFIDMDQSGVGMGGGGSIFDDIFGVGVSDRSSEPTDVKAKAQKFRRENVIVDVDVTKDD